MCVDDLCIAAQNPKELMNILKTKYQLKVKGGGPLTYHLGLIITMILMEQWYVNLRNILRN